MRIPADPTELLPLLAESGRCGLSLIGDPEPAMMLAGAACPNCGEDDVDWLSVEDSSETAHCDRCGSDSAVSEELVYYSAAIPAIILARCVPQPGQQLPADCATANIPIYQHRLVWFFLSATICTSSGFGLGGPMIPVGATPRPPRPPRSGRCIAFTHVDATTGAQGFWTSG